MTNRSESGLIVRPGSRIYQVVAVEKPAERPVPPPVPPKSGIVRRGNTRRYSIEIKDIATEKSVGAVAVDWTEYEKHSAIAEIMRLAGLTEKRR
jgi:hypothetical protein